MLLVAFALTRVVILRRHIAIYSRDSVLRMNNLCTKHIGGVSHKQVLLRIQLRGPAVGGPTATALNVELRAMRWYARFSWLAAGADGARAASLQGCHRVVHIMVQNG